MKILFSWYLKSVHEAKIFSDALCSNTEHYSAYAKCLSKLKSPHINTANISLSVYRHLNVSHLTRAALILGKHGTDTALKTNILAVARTLRTRMKTYIEIRLEHTSKSSHVTLLHTWEVSHFYTFIRQTRTTSLMFNVILSPQSN